jgi:hypothetical protein
VLYVDCGVHKQGEQLRCMQSWFGDRCKLQLVGFEASSEHCRDAAANLADLSRLDLRNAALVGPDAGTDWVKLYKSAGRGKADSLFRDGGAGYELAPAERLSTVLLREYGEWLAHGAVLLRMNIEGSEYDVIDDLVRSGVHARIDGYFGMWDDVSKLDPAKDRLFRRLLKAVGIKTVTFNDRDLPHPIRRLAIRVALDSAIRRGIAPSETSAAASR